MTKPRDVEALARIARQVYRRRAIDRTNHGPEAVSAIASDATHAPPGRANSSARRRIELLIDGLTGANREELGDAERQRIARWFRRVLNGEEFEVVSGLVTKRGRGRQIDHVRNDAMRRDFALYSLMLRDESKAIAKVEALWGLDEAQVMRVVGRAGSRDSAVRQRREDYVRRVRKWVSEHAGRAEVTEAAAMQAVAKLLGRERDAIRRSTRN